MKVVYGGSKSIDLRNAGRRHERMNRLTGVDGRYCNNCGNPILQLLDHHGNVKGRQGNEYCSGRCKATKMSSSYTKKCIVCGKWIPRGGRPWCGEYCGAKITAIKLKRASDPDSRRFLSGAQRTRLAGGVVEDFDSQEIYERDNWICHLCGEKIDPSLRMPDRMSRTLDHLIPISKGGNHTKDNVSAAHWLCNVRRGVKELDEYAAQAMATSSAG